MVPGVSVPVGLMIRLISYAYEHAVSQAGGGLPALQAGSPAAIKVS